ncbi:solute carrier family 25 (mitochondrial S-adenosylmethionine transporter), member 26 [Angomonas deanei]|uniref:Mitochondrial carrier protein, putative n=1 Tax=Angomonas deanei TaxID=59799 RepID=A0A7G2CAG6_9TRYP|nr:solute carrier family 25 (mitochondrial S-adenosylmethionine transporter), member 26 [Angomonas deanei]CAD2216445.1 Mitochondrial carrier protein, putative [Angomonas deanei]|eukprot:EPY43082.1 solute carrier family 25 (mitochondrial S-adenosylmethionine transporter), member 26 [Angomonas deanei]
MDSLIAGAAAGLLVDLSLFPIDTVKTRIQSKDGFIASGGFKNIYKGLSAVAIGSVPGGAAFFFSYDTVRSALFNRNEIEIQRNASSQISSTSFACQAIAAMCGETSACCIRVPVEMVKQQMQAGFYHDLRRTLIGITNNLNPSELTDKHRFHFRGIGHLFSGMPIMLLRELPFSVIQMSLYELLKHRIQKEQSLAGCYYYLLPLSGAVSGGIAAFLTTPLDVIKTRIMLDKSRSAESRSISTVVKRIVAEPQRAGDRFGVAQKFFRGASTRVLWISLGGGIFFGTYEFTKKVLASSR